MNKRTFERILAAREALVERRETRFDQLATLQMYLRVHLNHFLTAADPITGAKLAAIAHDVNRMHGEAALKITLFEGSFVRFAVDRFARYEATSSPDFFAGVRVHDLEISGNLQSAVFTFTTETPDGESSELRRADLGKMLDALLTRIRTDVEREAGVDGSSGIERLVAARAAGREGVAAG